MTLSPKQYDRLQDSTMVAVVASCFIYNRGHHIVAVLIAILAGAASVTSYLMLALLVSNLKDDGKT